MPTLRIDLQDGFAGDTVIVRVDDREVWRAEGVRSSRLLGFAHSMSADVPRGRVKVDVEVPSRGVSGATQMLMEGVAAYLGISIAKDGVSFHPSKGPFGYA